MSHHKWKKLRMNAKFTREKQENKKSTGSPGSLSINSNSVDQLWPDFHTGAEQFTYFFTEDQYWPQEMHYQVIKRSIRYKTFVNTQKYIPIGSNSIA